MSPARVGILGVESLIQVSDYADEQGLCFAELMAWWRLIVKKITVPDMHRPNRFVSVAVAT
ncbi:hypothetical protein [Marinobacter sp.]|uniref:hypothetical protein n=1 Tax=Marinobacter sp. TaxID=50741 RepID=UPI0019961D92|nr:hypothetical protein [Marinobacter sp.]MBC7192184.1 hypothetical protein [Marinobacter sp.]